MATSNGRLTCTTCTFGCREVTHFPFKHSVAVPLPFSISSVPCGDAVPTPTLPLFLMIINVEVEYGEILLMTLPIRTSPPCPDLITKSSRDAESAKPPG